MFADIAKCHPGGKISPSGEKLLLKGFQNTQQLSCQSLGLVVPLSPSPVLQGSRPVPLKPPLVWESEDEASGFASAPCWLWLWAYPSLTNENIPQSQSGLLLQLGLSQWCFPLIASSWSQKNNLSGPHFLLQLLAHLSSEFSAIPSFDMHSISYSTCPKPMKRSPAETCYVLLSLIMAKALLHGKGYKP